MSGDLGAHIPVLHPDLTFTNPKSEQEKKKKRKKKKVIDSSVPQ